MSQVEVDEMLRLVGNKASEIPADNAMPCCALFVVELEIQLISCPLAKLRS